MNTSLKYSIWENNGPDTLHSLTIVNWFTMLLAAACNNIMLVHKYKKYNTIHGPYNMASHYKGTMVPYGLIFTFILMADSENAQHW